MAEYTYEDIIMDPDDPRLEGAIGKECYFSDYPKKLLNSAIYNLPEYLDCLTDIRKEGACTFVDKNGSCWTLIIIKKEPCYEDQVKQWIEENNLKVGDYVKVTRRAENHADGLDDYWYDLMRDSVGKILKVKEISNFIMLDNGINYPYFVLEKTEPPKPRYVPFENGREFFNSYLSVESRLEKEDYFLSNHGIWLKHRESDDLFMVVEIWDDGVVIGSNQFTTSWNDLSNGYTFLNGTPCGKEVKDE